MNQANVPHQSQKPQTFETLIIGTGFSGLMAAIRLRKKGLEDFVMLERSAEMGGTWRDNSYPGAEVDIPTGLYSLSNVPYPFSKRYAPQSELLDYTNHIIEFHQLKEKTQTNRTVTCLNWEENQQQWLVDTASGDRYVARFVIDTSGVLANPHTPQIEGATDFTGAQFHSGQWDHNQSLNGKRVGVIGSGCSAAQIVPAIASQVKQLNLFMGKAQWVIPRSDRTYSKLEQRLMMLPVIRQLNRFIIFAYHEVRFVAFKRFKWTQGISRFIKKFYTRTLRKNLEKHIADPTLRAHMMPDYELGCRRVIPTNTYLPALGRDNVKVDISGIKRITATGIETHPGEQVPLDIIVYATGFYAYSHPEKLLTFDVFGQQNRHLNSEWQEDMVTYKGLMAEGFPNYFKVNGPNTGTGHSSQISYMQTMTSYIVKAICAVKKQPDISAIMPKPERQQAYMDQLKRNLQKTVWQTGGCSAFYKKNMTGIVTSLSPESMVHFIFSRQRFRLNDYQCLTAEAPQPSANKKSQPVNQVSMS
ncbi:flavin-containing monooxygenase [Marinicella sediminis]|uniref:Flavin-containing monooxygenase n=1 Tax=Marinicella sediminis TaxID=1792834 RepID=A0ABV7J9R1_9GAMM|nr:NAD(P)/FAD-dependent oxidoreductase [Marinicella sediminis]